MNGRDIGDCFGLLCSLVYAICVVVLCLAVYVGVTETVKEMEQEKIEQKETDERRHQDILKAIREGKSK